MIEKGTILRCKTTTKNDMFGTVVWEVVEIGLQAPEKDRRDTCRDGVKVILLSGTGPSARPGMTLIDSEWHILEDIKAGVTQIIPPAQKDAVLEKCQRKPTSAGMPRHGGTGVIEV